MSDQVRIYYGALGMWWRPDGCGYTYLRAEAGVYSREDASSRLSGDPARQERLIAVDDPWDPLQSSRNLTDLLALRERVTALEVELAEARKTVSECKECAGTGIVDVVVSWVAPEGDEVYRPETCPECLGTGIGVFGQTLKALAVAEDALRAAGFTLVGGAWVRPVPDEFTEWPGRDGIPPDGEWRYIYAGGSIVGRFRVGIRGDVIFDAGSGETYSILDFEPVERFVRVS